MEAKLLYFAGTLHEVRERNLGLFRGQALSPSPDSFVFVSVVIVFALIT
jgi:hypothetical protein